MKKTKEIIGLPIISIFDGTEIGMVKNIIFNAEDRSYSYLIVENGLHLLGAKVIATERVLGIGEHAVTVEDDNVVSMISKIPAAMDLLEKNVQIRGSKVLTNKGKLVGEISEIYVDEEDRCRIKGMEFQPLRDGNMKFLPDKCIVTYGRHLIIVTDAFEALLSDVYDVSDMAARQPAAKDAPFSVGAAPAPGQISGAGYTGARINPIAAAVSPVLPRAPYVSATGTPRAGGEVHFAEADAQGAVEKKTLEPASVGAAQPEPPVSPASAAAHTAASGATPETASHMPVAASGTDVYAPWDNAAAAAAEAAQTSTAQPSAAQTSAVQTSVARPSFTQPSEAQPSETQPGIAQIHTSDIESYPAVTVPPTAAAHLTAAPSDAALSAVSLTASSLISPALFDASSTAASPKEHSLLTPILSDAALSAGTPIAAAPTAPASLGASAPAAPVFADSAMADTVAADFALGAAASGASASIISASDAADFGAADFSVPAPDGLSSVAAESAPAAGPADGYVPEPELHAGAAGATTAGAPRDTLLSASATGLSAASPGYIAPGAISPDAAASPDALLPDSTAQGVVLQGTELSGVSLPEAVFPELAEQIAAASGSVLPTSPTMGASLEDSQALGAGAADAALADSAQPGLSEIQGIFADGAQHADPGAAAPLGSDIADSLLSAAGASPEAASAGAGLATNGFAASKGAGPTASAAQPPLAARAEPVTHARNEFGEHGDAFIKPDAALAAEAMDTEPTRVFSFSPGGTGYTEYIKPADSAQPAGDGRAAMAGEAASPLRSAQQVKNEATATDTIKAEALASGQAFDSAATIFAAESAASAIVTDANGAASAAESAATIDSVIETEATIFEQRQRKYLTGRIVTKTILDNDGNIIVEEGVRITESIIDSVRANGRMVQLVMYNRS